MKKIKSEESVTVYGIILPKWTKKEWVKEYGEDTYDDKLQYYEVETDCMILTAINDNGNWNLTISTSKFHITGGDGVYDRKHTTLQDAADDCYDELEEKMKNMQMVFGKISNNRIMCKKYLIRGAIEAKNIIRAL
jgi:hypothetical protein